MTWSESSAPSASWGDAGASAADWAETAGSNTTARNASRFIRSGAFADSTDGVDFNLAISAGAPFIITAADPRSLTTSRLNDPTT